MVEDGDNDGLPKANDARRIRLGFRVSIAVWSPSISLGLRLLNSFEDLRAALNSIGLYANGGGFPIR